MSSNKNFLLDSLALSKAGAARIKLVKLLKKSKTRRLSTSYKQIGECFSCTSWLGLLKMSSNTTCFLVILLAPLLSSLSIDSRKDFTCFAISVKSISKVYCLQWYLIPLPCFKKCVGIIPVLLVGVLRTLYLLSSSFLGWGFTIGVGPASYW